MLQSPTSFKSIFSSLTVSLLINGAVFYLFFFYFHHTAKPSIYKSLKIISIDIVNTVKISKNNQQVQKKYHKTKMHSLKVAIKTSSSILNKITIHKNKNINKTQIKPKPIKKRHKNHYLLHKAKTIHTKSYIKQSAPVTSKISKSDHTLPQTTQKAIIHSISKKRKGLYSMINIANNNHTNIFSWINRHKFYPMDALYRNEEGRISLSFIIGPAGFITNISIKKPSKYSSLNKAALKIIKNSSPIPHKLLSSIEHLPAKASINIIFSIE